MFDKELLKRLVAVIIGGGLIGYMIANNRGNSVIFGVSVGVVGGIGGYYGYFKLLERSNEIKRKAERKKFQEETKGMTPEQINQYTVSRGGRASVI